VYAVIIRLSNDIVSNFPSYLHSNFVFGEGFLSFFFVVLEFELRASYLFGRCSTTSIMPLALGFSFFKHFFFLVGLEFEFRACAYKVGALLLEPHL
jgi:hypothetical protein